MHFNSRKWKKKNHKQNTFIVFLNILIYHCAADWCDLIVFNNKTKDSGDKLVSLFRIKLSWFLDINYEIFMKENLLCIRLDYIETLRFVLPKICHK